MTKAKPKTKKTSTTVNISKVSDLYTPIGSNLCNDVLIESNGNVTFLRMLDFVMAPLPVKLAMWLVCDLTYNPALTPADYSLHDVLFEVELVSPKGKRIPLIETKAAEPEANKPMIFCRLLFNLSGAVDFINTGLYIFELYGKLEDGSRELLLVRPFALKGVPDPVENAPVNE